MKQFFLSFIFLFCFIGMTTAQDDKTPEVKKDTTAKTIKIRPLTSMSEPMKPLYILDGVEIKEITGIEPDQIKEIHVLKGEKAIKKYGKRAEGGVVEITLKEKKKKNKN